MSTSHTTFTDKPPPAKIAELRQDFAFNDKNKDGQIDIVEFRNLLKDLDSQMTDHEISTGFHAVDINRDGVIDFDEFVAWWTGD